jgi:hypothetical protein
VNQGKRLQRIETSLTPKQAVLLWLKGMLESDNVSYLEKLFAAPRNEGTRSRMSQAVGEAVRKSLIQQRTTPELMERIVRDAQKQADVLVILIRDLHNRVHVECTVNAPYIALLYDKLRLLLVQHVHQGEFEPEAWDLWRAVLMKRLTTMCQLRDAIAAISARYYDGHPVLFVNDDSNLNRQIASLEHLTELYNELENGLPVWIAINFDAGSFSMREQLSAVVAEYVAMAESITLEDFGEHQAARDVVDRYVIRRLKQLRSSAARQDSSTT